MSDRFWASLMAALLAYAIALRAGIPLWTASTPGDRVDLTLLSFTLVWYGLKAVRK